MKKKFIESEVEEEIEKTVEEPVSDIIDDEQEIIEEPEPIQNQDSSDEEMIDEDKLEVIE